MLRIADWSGLNNLESDKYKIVLDSDGFCGWIYPKIETEETKNNFCKHHVYLSTHTFYEEQYKKSTEILQKYGFDVILESWG